MPRRKTLTQNQLVKLPRKTKRYYMADPVQQGLILRIPPQGPIGYSAVAWRGGKQTWQAVGTTATVSLEEARALARDVCRKIQTGLPRTVTPLHSVAAVCDRWFELKAQGEGYRTAPERQRIIEKYIKPHLGSRIFIDLRRSDIADLLDLLADKHGKAQADQVLKTLSAVSHWYESRDDDYRSPLTRGMRRSPATQRERVLGDEEVRTVWRLASESGRYGALLKLALLTAQRRAKLTALSWDQIDASGVWHIPRAPREKQTAGDLKLPPLALDIIYSQPRLVGDSRVFRRPNDLAIANFRRATGLPHWTIHDLRRTARSLMSRAGVQTEISELVLGHSIKGIQKVYDRHSYFEEKGAALSNLAALIERFVSPPTANVVALGAAS
jgi:integrase